MNIEIVRTRDLDLLQSWREEVIANVFDCIPTDEVREANKRYYAAHIMDGTHLAVIALLDGEPVGCGAICFQQELPSPDNLSGCCAYLMNIYVRPSFRGKGVGRRLVGHLVQEAKQAECGKIYLETTAAGRLLYQSIGFRSMSDMMILKNANC